MKVERRWTVWLETGKSGGKEKDEWEGRTCSPNFRAAIKEDEIMTEGTRKGGMGE